MWCKFADGRYFADTEVLRAAREMASSSLHFLTVLTEDDGVSGFKFERKPEEYTVDQLKRWLKYRGLKLSGIKTRRYCTASERLCEERELSHP